MLPPDLHKISPAYPRQENIYTEVNVKPRAHAIITASHFHVRMVDIPNTRLHHTSEQFTPFVLFLTMMTHVFPVARADPYFIVNPSPTSWDPRAKMQSRDPRHSAELLSFVYSTSVEHATSLICHRESFLVVPYTKTYSKELYSFQNSSLTFLLRPGGGNSLVKLHNLS